MALSTLDLNTALIVVDLQKGIIGLPAIHPIADVTGHARALADAFRARSLPVVLVNVAAERPGGRNSRRVKRDPARKGGPISYRS